MSDTKLRSYIDRILRSRSREDDEKANTKEIYKELAGDGYDKTIVGKVVSHLRKDENKAREQSEKFDLYLMAYLGASHTHAYAREDETDAATNAKRSAALDALAAMDADIIDADTGEVLNEIPMSNASGQPGGADPETPDDAASAGETAPISTTQGGQDDHGGFHVGRPDDEQHDAAPVPGADGRREGEDAGDQGQGAGVPDVDRGVRIVAGTEPGSDQDRGSRHVGGEAHHRLTEQQTAMSAQTGAVEALVDQSAAPAPRAHEGAAVAAGGDSVDPSAVPAVPGNVTPLYRLNPATHFANSKGLPRLHGCTRPESCGGSHRALCFTCSTQHDGPAYQGGAA